MKLLLREGHHVRVADRHVSRQLLARVLQPVPESERSVGVLVRGEGGRELRDEVRARRRLEDRLPRSEALGFVVASGDEARDLAGLADGERGVDEEERLPARDAYRIAEPDRPARTLRAGPTE